MKTTILIAFLHVIISLSTQAALVHRYSFDSDATDSVGTAHGTLAGPAIASTISNGSLQLIGGGSSQSASPGGHLVLPGPTIAINTFSNLTLEAWYTSASLNWARVFDFGASDGVVGTDYIFYTPRGGQTNQMRAALTNGSFGADEVVVNGGLQQNQETHVAVVVDSTAVTPSIELFVNGSSAAIQPLGGRTLSGLSNELAYLGRSLYDDPTFIGFINEFRIWDEALTSSQITSNNLLGPDAVIPEPSSMTLLSMASLALLRRRRR